MQRFYEKYFIFLTLLALCCYFINLALLLHHRNLGAGPNTVERIKQTGTLRLITTRSVNSFYLYQEMPTGFEYDLAREFARYLNVDLDVVTPGWNHLFVYLDQGKGDFIAAGMAITKENLGKAAFSIPYMSIQQRVIHHNLKFGPKNIDDLAGRTIHVRRNTSYHSRLKEIKAAGIAVNYILHDNIPTEDLIAMVNNREITFTIEDSNIVLLNQWYFSDIAIGIPVQEKESLAWAVQKNDVEMLKEINRFFLYAKEKGILKQIIERYYANIRDFDVSEVKTFHERMNTHMPRFQDIIEKEAAKHGFDWRLMAAVVYQESRFDPDAVSFTNVRGLMQVTRATARQMGIKNRANPQQSIQAGIKYLKQMHEKFYHMEDEYQRMLFALASYNVGYGHVKDAMAIARQKGLDPVRWQSLKKILPLLSKPEIYQKTRHGYARGWEPVQYVERILTYYDILRQMDFS